MVSFFEKTVSFVARTVVAIGCVTATFGTTSARAADAADWLYFDLGEVIVTGNPTAGYTYVPGAMDYLKAMRLQGYKLALVSNIPESWGPSCGAKFANLQTFLGTRLHETIPMDWTLFDKVLLPPFDRYRKPHPFLFMRALLNACPGRALYVGEEQAEVSAAKGLGFATYKSSEQPGSSGPLPSLADVTTLFDEGFSFQDPAECDFSALIQGLLLPQDQAQGVQACEVTPAN